MEQRVADAGHEPSLPIVARTATEDDRERWNAFVDAADGAEIYHRYEWRRLLEDVFGHRTHYLLAEDATGELHGVLPLSEISSALFGRFMVSIPYFNYCGVLADSGSATRALIDDACRLAADHDVSHVELRHRSNIVLDMPGRSDKVAMLLDLPGDSDDYRTPREGPWRFYRTPLPAGPGKEDDRPLHLLRSRRTGKFQTG